MKIDKTELRIGNIVDYDHFEVEWHNGHWLGIDEGNYGFPEAIKISVDYLDRFLFVEVKPRRGIQKAYKKGGVRIELSNSGNFYYRNKPILYIHTLQNVYFFNELTGKELKLDETKD